jgi:hypothetical protein
MSAQSTPPRLSAIANSSPGQPTSSAIAISLQGNLLRRSTTCLIFLHDLHLLSARVRPHPLSDVLRGASNFHMNVRSDLIRVGLRPRLLQKIARDDFILAVAVEC